MMSLVVNQLRGNFIKSWVWVIDIGFILSVMLNFTVPLKMQKLLVLPNS